ncbi:MAG: DUF4127 family protein [Candidatus Eremiobacteraeota bacterium]|nr:DUF4127 family protein [Candidatus Eremiobacteraeota bacterium]
MKRRALLMKKAALFLCLLFAVPTAAFSAPIVLVPIDDRPVTLQLPQMVGAIAGTRVALPPRAMLGRFLTPGNPEAIAQWLQLSAPQDADAFVLSTDMLAYGGLIASRTPATPQSVAIGRLHVLSLVRQQHPQAWIGAFGTIMRLAPTGVPAIGAAKDFFAAYPAWDYLQQYANLHDPPLPSEEATAEHLRQLIGPRVLAQYLSARARNRAVDQVALQLTARGDINRFVLGQDDAGQIGLHIKDVTALRSDVQTLQIADRTSIEPGADELAMALVAHAIAWRIGWTPRIAVRYSTPSGAAFNDPLEFVPIDQTINSLISLCGGTRDDTNPDITLFVRVPDSLDTQDPVLLASIEGDLAAHKSVAVADLTFLEATFTHQAAFAQGLIMSGAAGKLDAYASWNTSANTVGTALAESIAAGAGRRAHAYNAIAHAQFMLNRFIDDYAYHAYVRPELNAELDAARVDHSLLLPQDAMPIDHRNRALLWREAVELKHEIYPQYKDAGLTITLPWDRTFETEIDVNLSR